MSARRSQTLADIKDLVADVARDDRQTLATLALLRNGHPQAASFTDTNSQHAPDNGERLEDGNAIDYPDPTGELGISHDTAVRLGRLYDRHIYTAFKALIAADGIRRQMLPIDLTREQVADSDDWCKNCIQHGHCAPRNSKTDHYCRWCITIHATWRFYPPKNVVDLHHNGEHGKIVPALQAHKRARK